MTCWLIVDILLAVIGTALATSLIPLYNKLETEDSTERAMGFLNSVVTCWIHHDLCCVRELAFWVACG